MFSGATGAVVASGDGKATSDKSFGLVSDVTFVISELPDVLFDEHAEHRPCGKLDRCGARGMLACDLCAGCRLRHGSSQNPSARRFTG